MIILKQALLPEHIVPLGAEGIKRIWREVKLKSTGLKRTKVAGDFGVQQAKRL